jgi:serine/threonine-protein kinase
MLSSACPLTTIDRIDGSPAAFLQQIGKIFAVFQAPAQDSGNVSYGVEASGRRYFVKTAGCRADPGPVPRHWERVVLLRNAVRLARSCRHPTLAELLAVIESPEGPLLIYRWAEGELLRASRTGTELRSAPARFRALPLAERLSALTSLYAAHAELEAGGWVAGDFYDGSLIYDFERRALTLVDLDHYRLGPYLNTRGRMYGSTRFMAPEEYRLGAVIDTRTTVFNLGSAAAVLLSDGSLDREPFAAGDALHRVVCRACAPERSQRFASVALFLADWRLAAV